MEQVQKLKEHVGSLVQAKVMLVDINIDLFVVIECLLSAKVLSV